MFSRNCIPGAPWIRIILVWGALFFFLLEGHARNRFSENCVKAYAEIFSLRFAEARSLIASERQSDPQNLVTVYLENYIDFLMLFIGEDRSLYEQLKSGRGMRIKAFEQGVDNTPLYSFMLGEMHLQWAMERLKFGEYAGAALDIRRAQVLFSENEKAFPAFPVNRMGLGVVHVLVSLVPENYKWMTGIMGLEGSLEQGMNEIRMVAGYTGSDPIAGMYRPQATFFMAFLGVNLQRDRKGTLLSLQRYREQFPGDPAWSSPLMIYARATVLMKNGRNDAALAALHERTSRPGTFPFLYLDYLEGVARLNKLDDGARENFRKYVADFRGMNYLRAAYQRMAWISLLDGDSANYSSLMKLAAEKGASVVEDDRQAKRDAESGVMPNPILLRARLLCDGGYYDLAMKELLNHSLKSSVRTKRDLIEYTYRMGRISQEQGNSVKALEYFRLTVDRGRSEPWYFAANAAYQSGLLYETAGDYRQADSAYRLCLSMKPSEYRMSIHQKAKAALIRIKPYQPKT